MAVYRIRLAVLLVCVSSLCGCQQSSDNSTSPTAAAVPARPMLEPVGDSKYGSVSYRGQGPAGRTQLKVYLPAGDHDASSLPCVLIAPAGTNLLTGSGVSGDYHDESLPYAEAGFAVVQYSLDGELLEEPTAASLKGAYRQFKAAEAGMANTRQAIAFVKERLPEVDAGRIYVAGHSSAGTISLLAAANFKEVQGAVAYAPCSDVVSFHAEFGDGPDVEEIFEGYKEFDRKYSPLLNVSKIQCPVFLFQAGDDGVVTKAETQRFAKALESKNGRVELVEVARGGHYQSMIQEGIPQAIEWLKNVDQKLSNEK